MSAENHSLPIICLFGPTASGKTALAFALADRYPVHLISVDSVQVYRGMTIGSAKPDQATLTRYPHALIDILEPEIPYSAAQFCHDARAEIQAAHAAGKCPVLVGGTMLYFYAFFAGLANLPSADPAIRSELAARMKAEGSAALHAELAAQDPETAAKIAPNDRQRIMRFLELWRVTGKTPSELYAAQTPAQPPRNVFAAGLNIERGLLHQRIAYRFHEMIADGFIAEVEQLRARGTLTAEHSSMRSVGYRQIWAHLAGETDREQAIELGIIATRQLAKRQITWMNNRLAQVLPFHLFDGASDDLNAQFLQQVEVFFAKNPLS